MCAYGYAAAHVYYYQTQGLIRLAGLFCISLGNCLLVQGMEDTSSGDLFQTGISCDGHQLIYYNRVYDIRRNADLITDLSCQNTA